MTTPDPLHAIPPGDADALDRWLESRPADSPAGRSGNGPEAAGSLQAVAARYHAALSEAEAAWGPAVPVDEVWEKIMPNTATTGQETRRGRPTEPVPPRWMSGARDVDPRGSFAGVWVDTGSTPTRFLTGSHWAVSAVMVVAVAVGIVALFRSFAGDDGGKIVDYGPATNPVFSAASTPARPFFATPAPATGDDAYLAPFTPQECEVDGEPNVTIGEMGNQVEPTHQDNGFLGPQPTNPDDGFDRLQPILPAVTVESDLPPRQYGPGDPASAEDAAAVTDANRAWQACTFWGSPSNIIDMQSGRFQAYPVDDTLGSELDALSRALVPGDGSTYIVIAGERGTTLAQANDMTTMGAGYVLPGHAIMLSDGRIAVPVTRVVPPGSDTVTAVPLDVRIFIQDPERENRWVLDEIVRLCAFGCDGPADVMEVPPTADMPALPGTPGVEASPVAVRPD